MDAKLGPEPLPSSLYDVAAVVIVRHLDHRRPGGGTGAGRHAPPAQLKGTPAGARDPISHPSAQVSTPTVNAGQSAG